MDHLGRETVEFRWPIDADQHHGAATFDADAALRRRGSDLGHRYLSADEVGTAAVDEGL